MNFRLWKTATSDVICSSVTLFKSIDQIVTELPELEHVAHRVRRKVLPTTTYRQKPKGKQCVADDGVGDVTMVAAVWIDGRHLSHERPD